METISYRSLRVKGFSFPDWFMFSVYQTSGLIFACPTFSGQLRVFHSLSESFFDFFLKKIFMPYIFASVGWVDDQWSRITV
ncbi:hypothetical protein BDV26DRAFT_256603 [Aspergillus bertholletiae]|uniref:Uncharacterized protein n=1 Tax=Aspergillus bertholletiae TaxID=1226010 RepID=A0A5N7BG76_9EURO|nr:hypothetical protein BDV26DRAFT_256603 [Aspergillus bertholletiae]